MPFRWPWTNRRELEQAREVKRLSQGWLLQLPNVVGVCTGEAEADGRPLGHPAIVVLVGRKVPSDELPGWDTVPPSINGQDTDVRVVSTPPLSMADYRRPVLSGDAVGLDGTALRSTAGMVYRWQRVDRMLVCWHCVAREAGGTLFPDVINPPAKAHRMRLPGGLFGSNNYAIGVVQTAADPLGGANTDAASVVLYRSGPPTKPARGWNAPGGRWDKRIDNWWRPRSLGFPHHHADYDADVRAGSGIVRFPAGLADAVVGSTVRKFGATTGETTGKVFATDLTVQMEYFGQRVTLRDQIAILGPEGVDFCRGGDSSAVVLDSRRRVVGMLYAGQGHFGVVAPVKAALLALHGQEFVR